MIRAIRLASFKCFDDIQIRLSKLTLLCGANSSGKSSAMHSIAILYQTLSEHESSGQLVLNGPAVSLGTLSDVLCSAAKERRYDFSIGLDTDTWSAAWTAGGTDNLESPSAPLLSFGLRPQGESEFFVKGVHLAGADRTPLFQLVPEDLPAHHSNVANEIRQKLRCISYIAANRLGPREVYPIRSFRDRRDVGARGEWFAWCLLELDEEPSNPGIVLPGEPPKLAKQVGAWLDHFFPGSAFEANAIPNVNLVELKLRSTKSGKLHRPQNVGFALTHVMPILVACILARPGDLIMIENPEAHLHPWGQSEMGNFLGLTAASGVQIIAETHSDHVLNGIRRCVAKHKLRPEEVAVHFFGDRTGDQGDLQSNVRELAVDENGKLGSWPDGFFDQIEKDLLSLP